MNSIYNLIQLIENKTGIPLEFIIKLFLIAVICLIINFIVSFILRKIEYNLTSRKHLWDKSIIVALLAPIKLSVWLIFINYIIKISTLHYPDSIVLNTIGFYIRNIGLIVLIAWFLFRLIKNLEINYFSALDSDTTLDNASSYLLGKVARISVFIISVIIILHTLGYNITTLLTVGGAGSIILGFAAKDILANLFGGIMVYLDKPFKVGDIIKTDQHNLEGTIEKIGWRSTRLRNFDKRPIYIPNNLWATAPVENFTRMVNRRIKEFIGIRYQDAEKLPFIIRDLEDALSKHDGVDHRQNLIIKFCEFGPSSLNIMVYVFTKAIKLKDFLETKQDILYIIINIIKKHDADFAFHTTTIDLPENYEKYLNKSI